MSFFLNTPEMRAKAAQLGIKGKNSGVIKMEEYLKNPSLNPNNSGGGIGTIAGGIGGGSSKPVATDHSHDSEAGERRNAAEAQRSISGSTNVGSIANAAFMGAKQQSDFTNLTNPKAELDRGGRIISTPQNLDNEGLDKVGIETAMNPPFAVPIQSNQSEELEGLYS